MQEKITAEIQEEKQALEAQLQVAALLPTCLPDGWHPYTDVFNRGFWIRVPWGELDLYRDFRRALGKGWRFKRSRSFDDGDRHVEYRNGEVRLVVAIKPPTAENPTCQLVKVGEKIEPVYKIVCS